MFRFRTAKIKIAFRFALNLRTMDCSLAIRNIKKESGNYCTGEFRENYSVIKCEVKTEKTEDVPCSSKIKDCDSPCYHSRRYSNFFTFTEEMANILIAEFTKDLPKESDLPKEPGSKYVDQFLKVMPNLQSSDEEEFKEPAPKRKKRFKKRQLKVGYNGKPLPDSCIIDNYDWLYEDKEWAEKIRHPVLKTPAAERLRSCVEAGEEMSIEVVKEIEQLAKVSPSATTTVSSAHQVYTAITKVELLPDEVPVNNLVLRVALVKLNIE